MTLEAAEAPEPRNWGFPPPGLSIRSLVTTQRTAGTRMPAASTNSRPKFSTSVRPPSTLSPYKPQPPHRALFWAGTRKLANQPQIPGGGGGCGGGFLRDHQLKEDAAVAGNSRFLINDGTSEWPVALTEGNGMATGCQRISRHPYGIGSLTTVSPAENHHQERRSGQKVFKRHSQEGL